jgi:hypothetical protein
MRRRGGRAAAVAACLVALAGCGDDGSSPSPSTSTGDVAPVSTVLPDGGATLPLVAQIPDAIAALEARLGGPQDYFEINATDRLGNLFVALNGGTVAQAWVYLDGELSSSEGRAAQGSTFRAEALTFSPATLLTEVAAQLPESAIDVVEIVGGPDGSVRYTVVVTSPAGGQLLVVVGPDGAVLSVEST